MTALPPELVDTVVDFLHADKDSLLACSLTCKAWLPASQYHLFYEIALTPPELQTFLEYIDSSSSSIVTLIRRLVVHRSVSSIMGLLRVKFITPKTGHLTKHLQRLESLIISELHWNVLSAEVRQLLSSPQRIKYLELHRVNFGSIHQTVEFICSFPALKHLSIRGWIMKPPFVQMSEPIVEAPSLSQSSSLQVHISYINLDMPGNILSLIEWLGHQQPTPTIRLDALRLAPMHDRATMTLPSIRNLVRMHVSLERLHIKAPQLPYEIQDRDDYLRDFVDVMHRTEIRSLSFDFILMAPDSFTPYRIAMVGDLLSQMKWCRLQRVSFAFVIARGSHMGLFDCDRIADILAEPHFGDLEQVRFGLHIHSASGDIDDQMETEAVIRGSRLSVFDARGVLEIDFTDEIEGTQDYR